MSESAQPSALQRELSRRLSVRPRLHRAHGLGRGRCRRGWSGKEMMQSISVWRQRESGESGTHEIWRTLSRISGAMHLSSWGSEAYLCGLVAQSSRWHLGGEENLFAGNARGTDCVGARLLIAVCASGVDVTVAGTEGMEGDGLGNLGWSVERSFALVRQGLKDYMSMRIQTKKRSPKSVPRQKGIG